MESLTRVNLCASGFGVGAEARAAGPFRAEALAVASVDFRRAPLLPPPPEP